eukprot:7977803-Pyramimonas_sp.AAC.1
MPRQCGEWAAHCVCALVFLGGHDGDGQCNFRCKLFCSGLGHAQPVAAPEPDRVFEDGNLSAVRGGHKFHSQVWRVLLCAHADQPERRPVLIWHALQTTNANPTLLSLELDPANSHQRDVALGLIGRVGILLKANAANTDLISRLLERNGCRQQIKSDG